MFTPSPLKALAVGALTLGITMTASAEHADKQTIAGLTEQWTQAWDIGTNAFNPSVFNEIFAQGENAISVFDNVQGDVITLSSVEQYMQTWGPFMAPLTVWSVEMKNFHMHQQGDMAYTTFRLVGTDTKGPEGEVIPFGQYGTHIWRKLPVQGWRIVHEHLTAYDIHNPSHED